MFVNSNICFIENINSKIVNTNIDNSSPSDMISFRLKNFPPMNIVKSQNIYITLKIGAFSTFSEYNLIANNFYKLDKNIQNKGIYQPFNDEIKRNKIHVENNPIIFRNNIGANNSEEFDDLFLYPFEDIETNIYDRTIPYYRSYINSFQIDNLKQSISILGNFEEISGEVLTEKLYKGISANLSKKDSRDRALEISDTYTTSSSNIESFLDIEIENNVVNEGLIKRNFSYRKEYINGIEYSIIDLSENSFSYISGLTKKMLYYNEETESIMPFDDNKNENDINNETIVMPRGVDSNLLLDEAITISHLGEID